MALTADELAIAQSKGIQNAENLNDDQIAKLRANGVFDGTPPPNHGAPAGVTENTSDTTSGGTFLGMGTDTYKKYALDPSILADPSSAANHAEIASRVSGIDARTPTQMANTTLAPASHATAGHAEALNASAATAQGATAAVPGDTRTGQMQLAGQLQAQANGQGPTLAQQRFKENTDRGLAQSLAMAASARGVNPAQALRASMDSQANIQGQAAQDSADLSQQEQMSARGQLSGVLSGVAGQDADLSKFNAGQAQQSNQFNAGAATDVSKFNAATGTGVNVSNAGNDTNVSLANSGADNTTNIAQGNLTEATGATNLASSVQQQKDNDDLIQRYRGLGMTLDAATQQAKVDLANANLNSSVTQEAARHGVSVAGAGQQAQTAGAIIGGIGNIVAKVVGDPAPVPSDKRVKENIDDGEEATRAFLKVLRPHMFDYKDEKFGKGRRLGVMAQDVEKGAPDIVMDDTDGVKKLDVAKALSASLASLGTIDKRLTKLEGGKRVPKPTDGEALMASLRAEKRGR